MHVLHVYKTYYGQGFGGAEQVIRQLGTALRVSGVDVSLVTLDAKASEPFTIVQDGITIHGFPMTAEIASNGLSLSAMRHFRSIAQTADLLHYHFPWPSGDLLHQLAPKNIPALVTYHSDIVRQRLLKILYAPLMEIFLRQMDAIVATSPNYIETSPVLQRFKDKTVCVPLGIDEATYTVPTPARLARWRAQLPSVFFLFVGALRYYKGLHTLIEAARLTGLPVVIAGRGPQEDELKAQAAGLDHVHFLGPVDDDDKMALLTLCHGFAFPSHLRSEAFGISLLEGAMMRKPLISCEIGTGTSYINRDGETGFVVKPEQPEAFAEAMKRLAHDPQQAAHMGEAGRKRYEALFTAAAMGRGYLELYQALIRRAGVPT